MPPPALPGSITLTPICIAIILTTPCLTETRIHRAFRRLALRLSPPATVLFVLVELYGVARGNGPLLNSTYVLINDTLSLVEFICALISITAWSFYLTKNHEPTGEQGSMPSILGGFIYGAACHVLSSNVAPSLEATFLSVTATAIIVTLLIYHACSNRRATAIISRDALSGVLLFNVTKLLAEGGDPYYYGTGIYEGSKAWYLAITATLAIVAVSTLHHDRCRFPHIFETIRSSFLKRKGGWLVWKDWLTDAEAASTTNQSSVINSAFARSHTFIVALSLSCAALFLLVKCLLFIFPPRHFSTSLSENLQFAVAAALIVLGVLLSRIETQAMYNQPLEENSPRTSCILFLQMVLIGLALSDFRTVVSLRGPLAVLCFGTLLCACGVSNGSTTANVKLGPWLKRGLTAGIQSYRKLEASTLLVLPATFLLRRCLEAIPNVHYLFDLCMLGTFCLGAWVLWTHRIILHKSTLSYEIEEAHAARACKELGFGPLQTDILLDTIHGYSIKEICARRNTTVNTVKSYRRRAYRILDVTNVEELKERLNSTA